MSNLPQVLVAATMLPLAAAAQTPELLEAVRFHRADALGLAQQQLSACTAPLNPEPGCQTERLALLTGLLVLSEGEATEAAALLSQHKAPAGLESFHAWYLAEALAWSGHQNEALAAFAKVKGPEWLASKARLRVAELKLAKGDFKAALPVFEQLKADGSPELLYQRALARLGSGKRKEGLKDLRSIAVRYPAHPHADLALLKLTNAAFTIQERLDRADGFRGAGQWSLALAELDAIGEPPARSAPLVAFARAQNLFALGREADAEAQLEKAAQGSPLVAADALLMRARKQLRAGKNAEARATYLQVAAQYPKDRGADEATYFAAWIAMQSQDFVTSEREFGELLDKHPRSNRRDEALWLAGFSAYRRGAVTQAKQWFDLMLLQFPNSQLGPQVRYWSLRAAQREATKPDQLLAVVGGYGELIRNARASFYALLAQERLRELKAPVPDTFTITPRSEAPRLPKLALATLLSQAGLFRDAAEEVQSVTAQVRGQTEALQMGQALQGIGEFGPAYALGARHLWRAVFVEQDPLAVSLLYPKAYAGEVETRAQEHGVDPSFVWAIMRRESAFRPDVLSAADARGLMQIIPPTAREIAKALSQPEPAADLIYAPSLNVSFGTWYLGALLRRFGHLALAAGAYNGGPSAVVRWATERPSLPLDEWVETIPYKETRGYVKQVTADTFVYRKLYGVPGQPLPLVVPAPKAGVTF